MCLRDMMEAMYRSANELFWTIVAMNIRAHFGLAFETSCLFQHGLGLKLIHHEDWFVVASR